MTSLYLASTMAPFEGIEVSVVGDAMAPRTIMPAIHEGERAARDL